MCRFTQHFDSGGFRKTVAFGTAKIPITQVPFSRIFRVRGEVAERLKAAVC